MTVACTLIAACLVVPASATAATAPTLKSPAAKADPATEGGSMKFEWAGSLQGDPAALDRSFFRVELISSGNMPAGAQAQWPADELENFVQTEPGEAATSATIGVPTAGEYRWRVCAWGVADVLVDNVIEQLSGGCSASRVITTVAAAAAVQIPGELKIENRTTVSGGTRTVFVEGPAQPTPVEPAPPVEPAQPEPTVEEPLPPATFQELTNTSLERDGSAVGGLGGGGGLDPTSDRDGLGGAVIGALGSTLPLVPIPFWTLLLLLACVPILRLWRRSVLGMFEWSDGSIDGRGGYGNVHGDLALVPVAIEVKDGSKIADGDAQAPAPSVPDAPAGGRHAA